MHQSNWDTWSCGYETWTVRWTSIPRSFEDLQALYWRLKENNVRMQRIGDHGISLGVYLLDPDDNEIEVYYEMPQSEWQWPADKGLFSGKFPQKLEEPAGIADH